MSPRLYRTAKIAAEITVPILLLLAWQLYTVARDDPKFPRPTTILEEFRTLWLFSEFDRHVVPSLERIGIGFAIACILGVVLGIPLGLSRIGRSAAMPHIEYWRAIPPPPCCRSRSSSCTRSATCKRSRSSPSSASSPSC